MNFDPISLKLKEPLKLLTRVLVWHTQMERFDHNELNYGTCFLNCLRVMPYMIITAR